MAALISSTYGDSRPARPFAILELTIAPDTSSKSIPSTKEIPCSDIAVILIAQGKCSPHALLLDTSAHVASKEPGSNLAWSTLQRIGCRRI